MTETASHLLELADLTRQFVRRGTPFDAVSHVDLTIDAGEFVAIVGRSGNGKSTRIGAPKFGNRACGWARSD